MASTSAAIVTGLTAAALTAVGFLAYQAGATVPAELSASPHRAGATPVVTASKAPRDKRHPTALPGGSGTGERVVYSLDDDRVWLVGARNRVQRTFKVMPSAVDPAPGTYAVTSRTGVTTGSDGTPVEHVVRFASVDGVVIGFSAAVDGSAAPPDPAVRTGGIRETREDGDAMWMFATIGQKVVVIR
ncbi:hypothetical protein [Streptomyces chromofuscus]|uniref:Secreted protein n=1 Tax=Streptomyces chromofuscus TaxID=42881 RepID=A0A7M2T2H1_STRCW|nr:hypothetical protein [Streptomyces chromofuscus]QOV42444.1 hypothetical protein IPT68_21700 [Streptomyces chromofuscus]GGT27170.1 hypothetical protein GCM10010254_54620 [Streptomyces chromofuscus]